MGGAGEEPVQVAAFVGVGAIDVLGPEGRPFPRQPQGEGDLHLPLAGGRVLHGHVFLELALGGVHARGGDEGVELEVGGLRGHGDQRAELLWGLGVVVEDVGDWGPVLDGSPGVLQKGVRICRVAPHDAGVRQRALVEGVGHRRLLGGRVLQHRDLHALGLQGLREVEADLPVAASLVLQDEGVPGTKGHHATSSDATR